MYLVALLVASCAMPSSEDEDTSMFADGCNERIESKLRWQGYCTRKFDLAGDEQSKAFCKMEDAMNARPWGYSNLTEMVAELLRRDPAVPVPMSPAASGCVDWNQTKGIPLLPTCNVHRFEQQYWKTLGATHSLVIHNKLNRKGCWDVVPAETFTTCTHVVERCLNSTLLVDTECKNGTAPKKVHTRQLGKTCPTLSQLKAALGPLLKGNYTFKEEYLRDYLGRFTVVIGDSITRGTGAFRYRRKKTPDGWGVRLFWGAKQLAEEMLGIPKGPQCPVAKDGLSTFKLRMEMLGKGISRHYYVTNAPRRSVHQCFKDTRPERRPSTVVMNIGTNDFLDDTKIASYEDNLKWLVAKMQHWSRGSLKGLILAVHPFPVNGRREVTAGGTYNWRNAVTSVVHRVAHWTRTEYHAAHVSGNRSYDWVAVHDFNLALNWCPEYNFADGIHPNARGHLLLAIDFLRAMLKS